MLATSAAAKAGTVGAVRVEIAASVPSVLNVILNGLMAAVIDYRSNIKFKKFRFTDKILVHICVDLW